ncbi:MAG TPA: histidinol-phosphate transaminase [Gammaproteobacteria bacterium]|nr:histidinol-phosphate transaminase [Gammaproteobacteria bacterium]
MSDKTVDWIRPEIRALSAYHVPDPGDLIKLDAMENPYTWPEAMVEEWLGRLRGAALNRYPDPAARALSARLREAMAVPEGQAVMLGNGSDELIQIVSQAVAAPGRVILAPEPSFVMYRMIATFCGMDYVGVPLADDFSLDREAMLAAIAEHQPAVVFLAYPNNPTGNLFDADDVRAVIEAAPGLVVVDEAYHAFADASFMPRLGEFDNLLVMRTVSKMGLAGLRLGLLAGPAAWLDEFDKVRLPYNINVLTQVSADFALEHREVLEAQTRQISADRETLWQALDALPGVTPYPSRANFILFRVAGDADAVFAALKANGVLIKNLNPAGGPLAGCLRVTVGKPDNNDAFLQALQSAIA